MKMSNEFKVGALALGAIIALSLGFRFLKGSAIFNRQPKLYAIFKSVGGLDKSNFVKINGLNIGSVFKIEPADANVSAIKVTINITEDVNIPVNSVAYISGSLLGASEIIIEKGNAKTYFKDGDKIVTREDAGLLGDLSSEAKPLMGKVRTVADSLTLLLSHFNSTLDVPTQRNLQYAIANLSYTTANLNAMLSGMREPLAASLSNIDAITSNIKNNNKNIDGVLLNANNFTSQLNELKLQSTLDSLNATLSELRSTIGRVSNPNGTIGALMNDRKLYNRLNDVALAMEILLDDVRVHPKRYVNISVFGRKNRAGELTAPAIKDSIPQ